MEIDIKTVLLSYTQLTIFLLMLSIGLGEGFKNLSILWKHTSLLIRSVVASFVLVPIAAMIILHFVPMDPSARIAVAAMAICPGAPLTYKKLTGMKASGSLAGSYQVTMSLFAIVGIPLWVLIFAALYPRQATVSATDVLQQVATVQLIPILLGSAVSQWVPTLAKELVEPVNTISKFMFLGFVVMLLVVGLPLILKVGVITVIGAVLFITAAILIGHYLCGPDPEVRVTMGLANSTRNAGLALALATANFEDKPGILAAIGAIALLAFVADAIYANVFYKKVTQST